MRAIKKEILRAELKRRADQAVQLGRFETPSDTACRLLNCLMKSWFGHNGRLWTLRAYLLQYDRPEYKKILSCISRNYGGAHFFNKEKARAGGKYLGSIYFDQYNRPKDVNFDGRLKDLRSNYPEALKNHEYKFKQ